MEHGVPVGMEDDSLFEYRDNDEDIFDIRPSCVGMDEEILFEYRNKPEDIFDIWPSSVGGSVGG